MTSSLFLLFQRVDEGKRLRQLYQRSWDTHKTQCKVLRTRIWIQRAAVVLDVIVGVIDANRDEPKEDIVRLTRYVSEELFEDKRWQLQSWEAIVGRAPERPRAGHVFKLTTNTGEIWALDIVQLYPPHEWTEFTNNGRIKSQTISLGCHRRDLGVDAFMMSIDLGVSIRAEDRGEKLGSSFLKGKEPVFRAGMEAIMKDMQQDAMVKINQVNENGIAWRGHVG
ncbi:hypothetical protein OQA88_10231 [Cercophora sp. LCS_1]